MIPLWGSTSGLNAGLSFLLPLSDAGAGAVNTTPAVATGSPTATFTRATSATTILSNGLIGSVGSGVARSCYSPAGVYLGYLAEEQRTNLCLQSADQSNASWVKTACTISADAVASPDGTTTADKIAEDNTTAQHVSVQTFTKAASALAYTVSVYLKQAERTLAFIQIDDATNGNALFFNLATGAVGSNVVVGTGFTSVTASITSAGNGFYRCIITATSTTGTSLRVTVAPTTTDGTRSYLGTTGSGIYAWGAQLEQASFATSYIPTTTASVTRNADVLTYASSGNVDGTVGTAYVELTKAALGTFGDFIGATNYLLSVGTGNTPQTYDGTTVVATANTITAGTSAKAASRWSGSAQAAILNAGTIATGSFDGDKNVGVNIGIGNGTAPNGTIKNVRIWTRALADGQLVALTTQ